jgi:protein-tyrosine kinase
MSIVQSAIERMKATRASESMRPPEPRPPSVKPVSKVPLEPAPIPAATHELPSFVVWPASNEPPVVVDLERLRAHGLYASPDFARRQQEDYRVLRREVIAATAQRPAPEAAPIGPIVAVTSALPGEGKSYTALNLALSVASEGIHDVLLIDADTVRRRTTEMLEMGAYPGLLDLLAKPTRYFTDYVRPTSIERLRVLPAGQRHEGASDLFSLARVGPLFAAINAAMKGHIVIVDTPPILLSSDTPVLTDSAGQVLLVVRAGHTLQDSVKEAMTRIKVSVPVGIVLNDWNPVLPSERRAYQDYESYRPTG